MLFYDDEVKLFTERELCKIDWFKDLHHSIKNDIIFSMETMTFPEGACICDRGEVVDKMFLIQEGTVQISLKLGYSQNSDRPDFIIERLRRGAIINHRAFLPF